MPAETHPPAEPALEAQAASSAPAPDNAALYPVVIWGLPLVRFDYAQTLDQVDLLIARGEPSFFITANLNYAMLSHRHPQLRLANAQAAFLLADGTPMVWYSRLIGRALPERVAGSDLIAMLLQRAAQRGHRVFLLGGAEGVARQVADLFCHRHPELKIVGVEAPVLTELSAEEHDGLIDRIREARPDLLLVAFGQPKGELWLANHLEVLKVPACVQLGASFDFLAGRARRAPRWLQRMGAEWLVRMVCEPRRMIPRYTRNALFMTGAIFRDLRAYFRRPRRRVRRR